MSGVHVLVVDDNEDARDMLSSYLELYGANVFTAQSGGEALAVAAHVRAHVIVSDLSMPEMTGIEFLRQLRALPGHSEHPAPAIAVTGFSDLVTRRDARDSGFAVYLTKPVDPMTVVEEVERLFHESEAGRFPVMADESRDDEQERTTCAVCRKSIRPEEGDYRIGGNVHVHAECYRLPREDTPEAPRQDDAR